MQASQPKQYLRIDGKTILEHSLAPFLSDPRFSALIVVVSSNDAYWDETKKSLNQTVSVTYGGKQRPESVLNGLKSLRGRAADNDWVLVHDAVRPCVKKDDIERLMNTLVQDATGGLLAVPVRDTLKRVAAGRIAETVNRAALWQAQTPQMFRFGILFDAIAAAIKLGYEITDEAQALELAGFNPRIVPGSSSNIKITYPDDLLLARTHLEQNA